MERVPKIALNNGIQMFAFRSFDELLTHVSQHKGILIAVNAEKVLLSTPQTRQIINSNISYCDGMGALLALRRHGAKDAVRIPGCELWHSIVESLYPMRASFYLVGCTESVIQQTVAKLRAEFPNIKIAGYRNGFFKTEEERVRLIDDVAEKKPEVVLVAMGSPKQEILMAEMLERHPAIYQGLGGSFNVYTGAVRRAPRWCQRLGIEFLFRALTDRSRKGRVKHSIQFFVRLCLGKI